jgi:hypothetical protein
MYTGVIRGDCVAGTPNEGGKAQKKQAQFRLDPTDDEWVDKMAADKSMSRSQFLRCLVHYAHVTGIDPVPDTEPKQPQ